MTPAEHKQRHIELHKSLDELFADYISNHPDHDGAYSAMQLQQFIAWSYGQTENPTEQNHSGEVDEPQSTKP